MRPTACFLLGSHPFWWKVSHFSDLISRQTKRMMPILPHCLLISSPPPLCPFSSAPLWARFIYPDCFLFCLFTGMSSSAFPFFFWNGIESYSARSLSSWTQLMILDFFLLLSSPHFFLLLSSCWHQSPTCNPPLSRTEWLCQCWLEPAWPDAQPGLV